jgi:hypothetical protein
MLYDAISLSEAEYASNIQQSGGAGLNANYEHTVPSIEMLIGSWYLDQFGNPTRQIKARD